MKTKNLNRQLFQRSMQLLLLFLVIIGFLQTSLIYLYTENQRKMEVNSYLQSLQQTTDLLDEGQLMTEKAKEVAEDIISDANVVFYASSGESQMIHINRLFLKNKQTATYTEPVYYEEKAIGTIEVTYSIHESLELMLTQLIIYVIASIVILLLAWRFYTRMLRKTLAPLDSVIASVSEVSVDNLDEPIIIAEAQADIAKLVASTNELKARLHDSFQTIEENQRKLQQFVSDASHELKTPLTTIQGYSEILLRGKLDNPEKIRYSLESVLDQAKRLTYIVNELLELSKLDRKVQMGKAELNLNDVLQDIFPLLKMIQEGRELKLTIGEIPNVLINRKKIEQVILNIVQNAIFHSDPKTPIMIRTYQENEKVVMAITDHGEGIAEEHLPFIFDRFYRIDTDRSRESGGTGLGLAICQDIMHAHNGEIDVQSIAGKETTFFIRFPKMNG
ncbi:phospho-acceptor domain-containing protein [Trichococcus patagoniensis]|uniref:histidine kinase n=1 Tax=Trichococcus patagoniensis TaxID=382641 RepID=A0A2T5IGR4_9LACT|nr:ATP-binding protein [Trichococcus patagoniensis]PTQ82992.1 phospho-acceptor domain-containing protein [Trichococcus patagoniensis]